MRTILAAGKTAEVSETFHVTNPKNHLNIPSFPPPVTLYQIGALANDETATLQYHNGTEWVDVNNAGTKMQLTATVNYLPITFPGEFRMNKAISAADVGIAISD